LQLLRYVPDRSLCTASVEQIFPRDSVQRNCFELALSWLHLLDDRSRDHADSVEKVFLGWRPKFFRAADAFRTRRREGPYRFIQNRSPTSVAALKTDAAAEKSKDQLSRDFRHRSIFSTFATVSTPKWAWAVKRITALFSRS
jgi:hypothetical protein